MRSFRGPVDGEDSEESDPDQFGDEIQAVFLAGPVDIIPDDLEEDDPDDPGVIMYDPNDADDLSNGPIFLVENDNEEDYEPSTSDSEHEPLEYDSDEENGESSSEEIISSAAEDNEVQGQGENSVKQSEVVQVQVPDAPESLKFPTHGDGVLPYANDSESDDLSSLGKACVLCLCPCVCPSVMFTERKLIVGGSDSDILSKAQSSDTYVSAS